MVAIAESVPKPASRFRFILDRRDVLGAILVAPAILYVLLLVGLPFLLAVYYSVSAYTIYDPSWSFVGLANFDDIIENPIVLGRRCTTPSSSRSDRNSSASSSASSARCVLLRPFPGRKIVRALIILPWAVPVALATVAWQWMFDSLYSVINWTLIALGFIDRATGAELARQPGSGDAVR